MARILPESIVKTRKDVIWKNFDEKVTILDLKTGDFFSITEAGAFIWKLLVGSKKVEKIASLVASHYNISRSRAYSDTSKFIKALKSKNLIILPVN